MATFKQFRAAADPEQQKQKEGRGQVRCKQQIERSDNSTSGIEATDVRVLVSINDTSSSFSFSTSSSISSTPSSTSTSSPYLVSLERWLRQLAFCRTMMPNGCTVMQSVFV